MLIPQLTTAVWVPQKPIRDHFCHNLQLHGDCLGLREAALTAAYCYHKTTLSGIWISFHSKAGCRWREQGDRYPDTHKALWIQFLLESFS